VIKAGFKRAVAAQKRGGILVPGVWRINSDAINGLVKKFQQPVVFAIGVAAYFDAVPISRINVPGNGCRLGVYFKAGIKSGDICRVKLHPTGSVFKIINLLVFKYMLLNAVIKRYNSLG